MDPNANLCEQRAIAAGILKVWDDCNGDGTLTSNQATYVAELANLLVELVKALDKWLSGGGFLPAPWRKEDNP